MRGKLNNHSSPSRLSSDTTLPISLSQPQLPGSSARDQQLPVTVTVVNRLDKVATTESCMQGKERHENVHTLER